MPKQTATPIREIGFDPQFIAAIRDGSKTQTRRAIDPQPSKMIEGDPYLETVDDQNVTYLDRIVCPYGEPGDYLRIRGTRALIQIDYIRAERLWMITIPEIWLEGLKSEPYASWDTSLRKFREVWNSIYEARGFGWVKNPEVWVIGFHYVRD